MFRAQPRSARALLLCLFITVFNSLPCLAQARAAEWPFYGGHRGGTRYSPLKQIDRGNVARLQRAWVYHTGELDLGLPDAPFQASFSCTPLVVEGVMYVST